MRRQQRWAGLLCMYVCTEYIGTYLLMTKKLLPNSNPPSYKHHQHLAFLCYWRKCFYPSRTILNFRPFTSHKEVSIALPTAFFFFFFFFGRKESVARLSTHRGLLHTLYPSRQSEPYRCSISACRLLPLLNRSSFVTTDTRVSHQLCCHPLPNRRPLSSSPSAYPLLFIMVGASPKEPRVLTPAGKLTLATLVS